MQVPSVYFIAVGEAAEPSSAVHAKVKEARCAAGMLDAFEFVRRIVCNYLIGEVATVDVSVARVSSAAAAAP
jgi:hypothetical protein